MPVFYSAYDTTFGRRYSTDPTKAAIAKATVSNYLTKNHDDVTIIEDSSDIPVDIPAFQHPLYVDKSPVEGLYVDARGLVSRNRQTGELKISSVADYNLIKVRAGLEHIWRTESPMLFRGITFPASVFSQWIAENVKRSKGLEPENQYKLTVFAAWFYYSLFATDTEVEEREYMKIVQMISKATRVEVKHIMEILDGQEYVKDINDFCARLYDVTGSVQLKDFSSILLYPLLNSTWFSSNSNEVVPVAVEHIPSFFAICIAAVTERAYSRSMLSKMVERVPAKNSANDFVLQITASLKS